MINWTKDECYVLPTTLFLIIIITIILAKVLISKSEKVKAIPLQIIAIIVLVLEIIKQILNIIDGFSTWAIPLHYYEYTERKRISTK